MARAKFNKAPLALNISSNSSLVIASQQESSRLKNTCCRRLASTLASSACSSEFDIHVIAALKKQSLAFNIGDIDIQALKQCELSSVIYGGTISTSVVSLMLEPIADKFARNHLIDVSPYELIDDITALKDIDTKIPDSIDVSNINFLSMLDQINTVLSAIMEGLIPCYDNLNKVIEYLTAREQVQTAFLMYVDEVREATTA